MVAELFLWFCAYALMGWVWESAYCTLRERGWRNRGFLFGPVCPIYGVCALAIVGMGQVLARAVGTPEPWQVFACSAAASVVVEWTTSVALERLFHARWWDYSDMPLNLDGRICLPATTLFGLAGLLVTNVVQEALAGMTASIGLIGCEALSLACMALLAADTALTVSALTRFAETARAINDSVNEHMERFVGTAFETQAAALAHAKGERERYVAALRDSRLAHMSATVRSAASRMHSIARVESLPSATELSELLRALRR